MKRISKLYLKSVFSLDSHRDPHIFILVLNRTFMTAFRLISVGDLNRFQFRFFTFFHFFSQTFFSSLFLYVKKLYENCLLPRELHVIIKYCDVGINIFTNLVTNSSAMLINFKNFLKLKEKTEFCRKRQLQVSCEKQQKALF